MIIVFAGCDCAGKSTCTGMFDKQQWRVEKGSANSDFRKAIKMLKQELKSGENVIHDRIPLIDDFVYTRVFANRESPYISYKDEVSELLKKCIIIYFDCDNDVIAARMRSRGDEYITPDQIPIIKHEYKNTFNLLGIKPYTVNTTVRRSEKIFQEVTEVIENACS